MRHQNSETMIDTITTPLKGKIMKTIICSAMILALIVGAASSSMASFDSSRAIFSIYGQYEVIPDEYETLEIGYDPAALPNLEDLTDESVDYWIIGVKDQIEPYMANDYTFRLGVFGGTMHYDITGGLCVDPCYGDIWIMTTHEEISPDDISLYQMTQFFTAAEYVRSWYEFNAGGYDQVTVDINDYKSYFNSMNHGYIHNAGVYAGVHRNSRQGEVVLEDGNNDIYIHHIVVTCEGLGTPWIPVVVEEDTAHVMINTLDNQIIPVPHSSTSVSAMSIFFTLVLGTGLMGMGAIHGRKRFLNW